MGGDQYDDIKSSCLKIAKSSWRINKYPPYIIGFRDGETLSIPMPSFIFNQAMQETFLETISSEGDLDATAFFHQADIGNLTITLIMQGKVMTVSADIIDDYGGVYLSDFSEWQELGEKMDYSNGEIICNCQICSSQNLPIEV